MCNPMKFIATEVWSYKKNTVSLNEDLNALMFLYEVTCCNGAIPFPSKFLTMGG